MSNSKSAGLDAADLVADADVAQPAPTAEAVRNQRRRLISVAAVTVVIDQLSKMWAVAALDDGRVIEGVLGSQLRLVFNTGSAFSLGSGYGPLFGVLAIVVAISLWWVVRQVDDRMVLLGLGLVQGGAIGNVLDRLFREGDGVLGGAVIDFLEIGDWWPVFNIADVGIVVGGILVVLFGSRA